MRTKPTIPKGMRDFNSNVMSRRSYIFDIIRTAFSRYGYLPIETPSMENIQTLTGKYGNESDRLIFKILNSGDFLSKSDSNDRMSSNNLVKKISEKALRYDLTVPFARFVAQNRNDITFPFKRYQMQNVWRADKPQKGRYREFYQCDADIIGTDSLLCEIDLIQLYDDVFTRLNLPNIDICINNRKILIGMIDIMGLIEIFDDIVIILDKLENIGLKKVKQEIIKKGANSDAIVILEKFINVKDLDDLYLLLSRSKVGLEGLEELKYVIDNIQKIGLQSSNLKFNITLARGLDYYTGSILEVITKDIQIGAIGGGGRYDNLTGIFGLRDISGVGISFGIDRIYLLMEELNLFPDNIGINTRVMFVNFGEKEALYCLPLLKQIRSNGISAELYPYANKLKKQMLYANTKGINFVIMIGDNEIESGMLSIKDMQKGEQSTLSIQDVINKLS